MLPRSTMSDGCVINHGWLRTYTVGWKAAAGIFSECYDISRTESGMALVLIPVCAGGMQTVSGRAGTLPHKRQLLAARTWQYVVARLLNAPQLFCVKQDNLRCCSRVLARLVIAMKCMRCGLNLWITNKLCMMKCGRCVLERWKPPRSPLVWA